MVRSQPAQEVQTVRVATYTRISTDEEHQPYSLEAQAERLGAYVASQDGWEHTRSFTDQCSGATLERSGLRRALAEARAGRYDLLLVYRVDRLARSVRGLAQILEDLDAAAVAFRSATEPFDTTSSAGRMMVQMLGVFAEFERATIVDRVIAGMERKAARGGWNGGPTPFGYTIDSGAGALARHPTEAAIVPLIFDLYAHRRLGSASVAAWLNERGHRTRTGRLWTAPAVLTVLRNRTYSGEVFFRGLHHPGLHTPLVGGEVVEAAEAILRERGEDWSRRASNPSDYLLAGVVVCGRCGHRYLGGAAHGNGGRYRYYSCWSRLRRGRTACDADRLSAPELEAAVLDALRDTFEHRDLLAQAVAEAQERMSAGRPRHEEELAAVEREIGKAEETIRRYLAAFEAGTLPEAVCGARVTALGAAVAGLRRRREELVAAVEDEPPPGPIPLDDICADVIGLLDAEGDVPTRKALVRLLIEEIRVDSRAVIVPTFRVPPERPVRIVDGVVRPEGLEPPHPAPEAGALSS
jgi:site-specific DNA recombinase